MSDEALLAHSLGTALPGFRLELREIPGTTLRLWLMDDACAQSPVDPDHAGRIASAPPYWALCWGAGRALAEHIQANPTLVRGRTVVDLGAGSGIVAIAASLAGAARIYAVDTDPDALIACRANAQANGARIELRDDLESITEPIDLMTLADVFYDPANLPLIAKARSMAANLLVGEARRGDMETFGLRRVATIKSQTWPDFGDPQFETVGLYVSAG